MAATPPGTVMRKALLFIFAIALLAGGAYLLAISLMHPNFYSVVRGAGMAVIFIGLGAICCGTTSSAVRTAEENHSRG